MATALRLRDVTIKQHADAMSFAKMIARMAMAGVAAANLAAADRSGDFEITGPISHG
jgi:hypothetical protein